MFDKIGEKIVVGVVSAVALGAIYTAWDAIKNTGTGVFIPKSAVVAFDTDTCPDGWEPHRDAAGRFIVGAGANHNRDANGKELTNHRQASTGGAESHVLTKAEMPAHNHGGIYGSDGSRPRATNDHRNETGHNTEQISTDGESQPHNNMPPFVALLYCVKT